MPPEQLLVEVVSAKVRSGTFAGLMRRAASARVSLPQYLRALYRVAMQDDRLHESVLAELVGPPDRFR